ncbi:MAG: hypothetical protein IKR76_07350, partial [Ruminococcus sp.]|nr:hypothetical protein [Ruminococcus sp.]
GAAAETVLRLPPIGGKSRAKRGDTASPQGEVPAKQAEGIAPERCSPKPNSLVFQTCSVGAFRSPPRPFGRTPSQTQLPR